MKYQKDSEDEAFRAYIKEFYGDDLPEEHIQDYKKRAIEFVRLMMKIDIDKKMLEKIRSTNRAMTTPEAILEGKIKIIDNNEESVSDKENI